MQLTPVSLKGDPHWAPFERACEALYENIQLENRVTATPKPVATVKKRL